MTNTRNVGYQHRAAVVNAATEGAAYIAKHGSAAFAFISGYIAGFVAGPQPMAVKKTVKRRASKK